MTTIFIPISRPDHLSRLFASLDYLNADPETTSILTMVDGDTSLFVEVRNLTEQTRFKQRLCVQWKADARQRVKFGIEVRRRRIAELKNASKQYLADADFIFGIEDDTIVPPHALERLQGIYAMHPHAGFAEGVELGRWGFTHVGAWRADDVYEPTIISSVMPGGGIEEIDAGGFYCYLTRATHYLAHDYEPFDGNGLGPDVNYGLWLRRQGLKNYLDWGVQCEHRTGDDVITLSNSEVDRVTMVKDGNRWRLRE